jgi:hypothetical protein
VKSMFLERAIFFTKRCVHYFNYYDLLLSLMNKHSSLFCHNMAKKMRFITPAFGENSVLKKYVLKVSKFFLKRRVAALFHFL